jgi:hypothetical protein
MPLSQMIYKETPSKTKELLKEPNETLDKVIDMSRKWESPSMSYHYAKEIKGQTNGDKQVALKIMCDMIGLPLQHLQSAADACPYCEKPRHTREQCRARKFDEDLTDKVQTLIPCLKRIYKTQEDINDEDD